MAPQPNTEPNLFELKGDATITYSTSSIAGQPQLSYHDSQFNTNFSGADIRTLDSELGKLVTVSLVRTVDTGYTSMTLLVPSINLAGQTNQKFDTIAIVSQHHTSLLPGQHGARQSYKVLKLHGTAKFVEF